MQAEVSNQPSPPVKENTLFSAPVVALSLSVRVPKHRSWIFGICRRVAGAVLALAIMLVPAVVASRSAQGQTYFVVHSFTGAPDGTYPRAGLVRDSRGNLYGTTENGGDPACDGGNGCGTVFKVDTTGKEAVLYSFTGTAGDGIFPVAGLVLDAQGNLYGTTVEGGDLTCYHGMGCGTVFKVDSAGNETVLYRFTGSPDGAGVDGTFPQAGLVLDAQGNLYGTTEEGGEIPCNPAISGDGCGTVFKVDTAGNETVLYRFTGTAGDGALPFAGLIRDAQGNLYGTTAAGGDLSCGGGVAGCGTVFKLDTAGNETVMYNFTGLSGDGDGPQAGLVLDAQGNLYGTTSGGGDLTCRYGSYGCGTVFKLDSVGHETVLHIFTGTAGDGEYPTGLVRDAQGNLYGTTIQGGDLPCGSGAGCGTVFKLDSVGNQTVLYSFTGGADGANPYAGLSFDSAGNLYGTAESGGAAGDGVVFELPISNQYLGSTGSNNPQATYAEPVSTGNGNYFYQHTDFSIPGRGIPLIFQRTYNALDNYVGPLGANWTHSYNLLLTDGGSSISIKWGDGHTENYALNAGLYVPPPGVYNTLVKNQDGTYLVTQKDQTKYNFDTIGTLASVADKNGNQMTFSYDSKGHLAQITDTVGRVMTLTYDKSNRIIRIVDPSGRKESLTYSSNNDLATVTDPLKGVTSFTYDTVHHVATITLPGKAPLLTNVYDSSGRVISQTNGNKFITTFAYSTPTAGQTTITDPLGNAIVHTYDDNLRIVQITDALNGTISYSYDANNDRTSVTNQNGQTTAFTYDSMGNVTNITDPLGDQTSYSYDTKNDLTTSTNANGKSTTFTYDSNGNLTTAQDPLSHVTKFGYDSFGELTSKTDARNNTTTYAYDSYGDLTKITDALNDSTTMGYDGIGRLTSVTDAIGHTMTSNYDALSRLVGTTDALGDATQFKYSSVGNLTKVTDANNNATTYLYDAVNNLTEVTDAAKHVTKYAYDANSNRISFTNAKGKKTSYAYDKLNRLSTITDPLQFATAYSCDPVGNIASITDANGHATQFTYDAVNHLTGISYFDGSAVSYAYDPDGDRTSLTDSHGTTAYTYDALDRVNGVVQPGGATVAYSYDAVGHRIALNYPDSKAVSYSYDAANRLSNVTDWLDRITSYSYDSASRLLGASYPNTASISYAYDSANRLTNVSNTYPTSAIGPTGQFSTFTYSLDKVGNRVSVTDGNGNATSYTYDPLYELTSATNAFGTSKYTYDAFGNRLTLTGPSGTTTYKYDNDDRLLSTGKTSFTYDKNGNRITEKTAGQTLAYSYDAANRLVSDTGGTQTSTFAYDGDGHRLSQTVPSGTYTYTNDLASPLPVVLQENGPDGFISYDYGLGLISESSSSCDYFYHPDGLGSIVGLTDASGALQQGYIYDPWGNNAGAPDYVGTANKFRFTGQALDPGTELYFLRARYYDPIAAAFESRDPVFGLLKTPGTLNRYRYAGNNPVLYADVTGLSPLDSSQPANISALDSYGTAVFNEIAQESIEPIVRWAGTELNLSPILVGKTAAYTTLLGPAFSIYQSVEDARNHPERSLLENLQRGSIDFAVNVTLTLGSTLPTPAAPIFKVDSVLYEVNRAQVQNAILNHFGGWLSNLLTPSTAY